MDDFKFFWIDPKDNCNRMRWKVAWARLTCSMCYLCGEVPDGEIITDDDVVCQLTVKVG